MTRRDDELLDVGEFAEMFGVKPSAVWQWKQRGIRPEPDAVKSGQPVWRRRTLRRWGLATGRLPTEEIRHYESPGGHIEDVGGIERLPAEG